MMNDLLSRAMRLLSQRDHSEAELRRKLAAQPFVAKARFGGKGHMRRHHRRWLKSRWILR